MTASDLTPAIDSEREVRRIVVFMRQHAEQLRRSGIALGMSGGLDSTVTAALCAQAAGSEHVTGLILSERQGEKNATEDARFVADWLGIRTVQIDITRALAALGVYRFILARVPTRWLRGKLVSMFHGRYGRTSDESPFVQSVGGSSRPMVGKGSAHFKSKHRMRVVALYHYAESHNLLVAGAANRTERMTGLFSKFGVDHCADIMPVAHLYRTQLIQMAQYLGVPERIFSKPPNPGIVPGVDDKYRFLVGMPGEEVDRILVGVAAGLSDQDIASQSGTGVGKVASVRTMYVRSAHMRSAPAMLESGPN